MKIRILNSLCYLGFAPEVWLFESRKNSDQQLQHHTQNGLALALLLLFLILFCLVMQILQIFIAMNSSTTNLIAMDLMDILSFAPFLGWAVLFVVSLLRSFRKFTSPIPLISRLAAHKTIMFFLILWGFILQLIFIIVIGISVRANYLARPHTGPSAVYMLYENVVYFSIPYIGIVTYGVPEWFFPIGFYPIAETSAARWGDNSITVEPLTRENIKEAFQNGRLVVVASHGGYKEGTISLSDNSNNDYSPEDVEQGGGVGSNLQFVYIAGCNAGNLETQWIQSLAPAKVLLFNRISWIPEHIYWLLFEGPKAVSQLK